MRVVFVTCLLALVVVPTAVAKDWVQFDRLHAHTGDRVAIGSSWNSHPNGLVAYLVPMVKSPRFWHIPYQGSYSPNTGPPPRIAGVVKLGRVPAQGRAVRLVFSVPAVPAGVYVLGIWCVPCNSHWTTALPNYQPSPYGMLRDLK
jgi:hypothetical protein